jgi:26S proteasome regulatory subunit T2
MFRRTTYLISANFQALRERRMRIMQADFRKAKEKVMHKKKEGVPEGLYL